LSTSDHPAELWVSGGAYESFIGRWSQLVARAFLAWLNVPSGSRWLDVGCGTGALSQMIVNGESPAEVKGIDSSASFVASATEYRRDPKLALAVGDAQSLPFSDESFDVAVSGLMLNFVPDPERAVREMRRVVRSGGTVGAYVWDYAQGMEMLRYFWDAAVSVDPVAKELDEARRFPLCQPEALGNLFRAAGLEEVETRSIDVPTIFRDFDDYWSPFLGGQGPAPGYAMSLSVERRSALRERLRRSLSIEPDGSIRLNARAWAVRGTRPITH
jgi:SAM-dependent methyltransferase